MRKYKFIFLAIFTILLAIGLAFTFTYEKPTTLIVNSETQKPAQNFQVTKEFTQNKKEFSLNSLRDGKPTILHFWATWCAPCIMELPELIELSKKQKNYNFIAIAEDDSWNDLEQFFLKHPNLSEMKNSMTIILDSGRKIANTYGSSQFPETFILNKNLIIEAKFIGAKSWLHPQMTNFLNLVSEK